jgi:predicted membrane channel-forming protein YqfA (hemolysin III family)
MKLPWWSTFFWIMLAAFGFGAAMTWFGFRAGDPFWTISFLTFTLLSVVLATHIWNEQTDEVPA